jgi:hypothetical protein
MAGTAVPWGVRVPGMGRSVNAAPVLALYGTATVSATASSGLAVRYSSLTPTTCTVHISSGVVTSLAAGNCSIAADQPGDANYNAAAQITQTLAVPGRWGGRHCTRHAYRRDGQPGRCGQQRCRQLCRACGQRWQPDHGVQRGLQPNRHHG